MSNTGTRKERTETISDLSLKLKQQKNARNSKIRVRLTQKFKKPSYFTAHLMVFLAVFISLVFCLTYLSNRGENTDLIKLEKSQITLQKEYEKDFTSTGHTIKNPNIILNPYKNSPLTALIIFETEDEVSPTVTIPGKDDKTTLSHNFVKSKKHYLPIYGLYPGTINKVKISYETPVKTSELKTDASIARNGNVIDENSAAKKLERFEAEHITETSNQFAPVNQELNQEIYSDKNSQVKNLIETVEREFEIKTDPLPVNFPHADVAKADRSKLDSSFYFLSPATKNGYMSAYDINGDVRWYLTTTALWENTKLSNGHLLISTERLLSQPYYMTGLYEIDLLGKIYAEYSLPGGYHHDYFELQNGNLIVASNNFNQQNHTVEDYIVEIDRKTGEVVKKIDLQKILKKDDGKNENWTETDWFHNNSIYYDKNTNSLILSGRHQDAVVSIDYTTTDINWILGDPTNWSSFYQKYFLKPIGQNFEYQWSQHAAKITPEGYLTLFDNGNNKSKNEASYVKAENSYSRAVIFRIDQKNKTVEQLWQFGKERGSDFYSPYISDFDYLSPNHYLVHSGGIVKSNGISSNQPAGLTSGNLDLLSDTVELQNNQVIFELHTLTNNYRAEKMDPYAGVSYTMQTAKQLGTLGFTEYDGRKQGFITNSDVDQSFLDEHNISLKNEEDRLVVTGRFRKGDEVRIGLYRNFYTNYYNIPVSKHPYSALCVDILNNTADQEDLEVTKYINKDGLRGNYSVYIEYNGKLYNTGKYFNAK